MTIVELLISHRKNKNLTQAELGRKLGFTTGQYIYNCESGRCLPSVAIAKKLCKLLHIPEKKMRDAIVHAQRAKIESKWR